MRSTTSGVVACDVTIVDSATLSRPGISSTAIVTRDIGSITRVIVCGGASCGRKVMVAVTAVACGFAISRSVSKKLPVAPSARYDVDTGAPSVTSLPLPPA